MREERPLIEGDPEGHALPSVVVVDGERWRHAVDLDLYEGEEPPDPAWRTWTYLEYLFDPRQVAVALDLTVAGPAVAAGREGMRLQGLPLRGPARCRGAAR